jgi:Methyltransferase domain
MSAEIRAFLDVRRGDDAGLSVLDFGGGSGELVGAAVRPQDHVVIIEAGDDRSAVLASESDPFDALVFSHVLVYIADPIALFAELAAYSRPRAGWLAIVLDDSGTQADICREAAKNDARFLNNFGQAQRIAPLLDAAGISLSSHTIETRAVARSRDDLLSVVAFYLDGVIDDLVERLAATIAPEPNGDYVLTMHHRVFTWPSD